MRKSRNTAIFRGCLSVRFTYLAPLGNLGLGDVLDGHGVAVLDALSGVHRAETALPQLGSHAVRTLRRRYSESCVY